MGELILRKKQTQCRIWPFSSLNGSIFFRVLFFITLFLALSCFCISCADSGSDDNGDSSETSVESSDTDGDGIPDDQDSDIDGDGLSNTYETETLGTSPYLADTDGDGWQDNVENSNYVNKTYFNPLVADMPAIDFEIVTVPQINMDYTLTTGTETSYTYEVGEEFTRTETFSNSYVESVASEYGWSVESGWEFGTTGGKVHAVGHFTMGASGAYTNEESWEWGEEQSISNTATVREISTNAKSESLEKTGGYIGFGVTFNNTSNLAYTVNSLTLSAYKLDPFNPDFVKLIGTLSYNTELVNNQSFTLDVGQESGVRYYINDGLKVNEVLDLMDDSSGIVLAIGGFDMTMNGKDFTTEMTNVAARTAKVLIDYGPSVVNKTSKQYSVATKTNIDPDAASLNNLYQPVALTAIMSTLGAEVVQGTTDGNHGVQSVNGLDQDPANNKFWTVTHWKTVDGVEVPVVYAINKCSYDISNIAVETGDSIHFSYNVDKENDGLGLRIETMHGTSDTSTDSDGDGISDFEELSKDDTTSDGDVRTDPANPDTDGDSLNDKEDPEPLTMATSSDTRLSSLTLTAGGETIELCNDVTNCINTTFASKIIRLSEKSVRLTPTANAGAYMIEIKNNGVKQTTVVSGAKSNSFPLSLGDNAVSVIVTATDETSTEQFDLTLRGIPAPVTLDYVRDVDNANDQVKLQWQEPDATMHHFDGFFLVRSDSGIIFDQSDFYGTSGALPLEGENFGSGAKIIDHYDDLQSFTGSPYMDSSLSQGVTYYYALVSYAQEGSTYFFNETAQGQATTNALPDAMMDWRVMGMLGVDENDAGAAAEYKWRINAYISKDGVRQETHTLSEIGLGTETLPENEILQPADILQVSLTNGEVAIYRENGNMMEVEKPGYDTGTTYSELLEELFPEIDVLSDDFCTANDTLCFAKSSVFPVPREAGYSFTIEIKVWETDGDWDLIQNESYTFTYNDTDDTWISSDITYTGPSANWNGNNETMLVDKRYIFNPFYEHDTGDVQFFIYPKWTVNSQ